MRRLEQALRQITRDQRGQVLASVLVLLVLGALLVIPTVSYSTTGLKATQVTEKKAMELYAADSGVEHAFWKIQNLPSSLPGQLENPGDSYIYPGDEQPFVNEISVGVTIQRTETNVFRVLSTAVGTEVESFITTVYGDYSDIMDSVITSQGDYTLQPPTTVDPPEGEEHGPVRNYGGDWPTPEELSDWYSRDVKDEVPYSSGTLDVKDYASAGIGPLYRNGTLSIKNTGSAGLTLQLNGTLYITGDTLIGKTGKDFTLDLNGNTIFVESATVDSHDALVIGGKCTITGSGCIIAVGDIDFRPGLNCTSSDYVFVMSVIGKTYMQPNGDFYGTLAGSSEVYIQNGDAHWTDPSLVEGGLNLPGGGGGGNVEWKLGGWDIS
ncbi:MAG: pilus assembly protein PilZ [Candidatus Eisenbacteria sp.]|nr:pilus assembly protein PilZ [Candidatus Eisenbacteria bacterium]